MRRSKLILRWAILGPLFCWAAWLSGWSLWWASMLGQG